MNIFRRSERIQSRRTLNSMIADAHRLQRKLVGLIVAVGGFLALTLSFLLIVAGISLMAILYPPSTNLGILIPYAVVCFIAALLIGILIERLTTTNSTKLRILLEKVSAIEARYAKIEEPTEEVKKQKEREMEAAQKGRGIILFLIALGTSLSMLCESLLIHMIFASWNLYAGWGASILLSGLVSYTLISSELHKHHEEGVIRDSLNIDDFLGLAAHATIKDQVHENLLKQSAVKVQEITSSAVMTHAIDQAVIKHVDEVMQGNGEIVERITGEREYARLRAEQERERTKQQLSIIHGGRDDEETVSLSNGVMASFAPSSQEQKSKNYLEIERIYQECGDAGFTPRLKNKLSRRMGVSTRHIDRILTRVKQEEGASA